ncbi:MAG: hypothetical protein BWK76_22025 [Desulfobulbaceae bacterium A2]|nr:MAG: hypothetical protein BWK76_22025 [Desulfobulbaceae bacterium A2]
MCPLWTERTGPMVELVKADKHYSPDVTALCDISCRINRGEMFFLTGMSGAGKTTLLRLLCRMETLSSGYIEVGGQDLARLSRSELQRLRRRIGFAYQDFKLLPERSVAENIALAMEVVYKRPAVIRNRIQDLLIRLRLEHKRDQLTGGLSRGEQQRVAIARAVANSPDIILADEPTGNLDAESTRLVMDIFRQLQRTGTTIIIATHDTSLFADGNDRVMELRYGHAIALREARSTPPDERLEAVAPPPAVDDSAREDNA